MTDRAEAELARLARTLGADRAALAGLEAAGPEDLRRVRELASDHLVERGRRGFERVIAVAERLPGAVAAQLAQRVLGPVLAARAAVGLSDERAADLIGRLPTPFLAEIATQLDVRHSRSLIAAIPPGTIALIARRLGEAQEWIAMGDLVGALSPEALAAAMAVLEEDMFAATLPYVDPERVGELEARHRAARRD